MKINFVLPVHRAQVGRSEHLPYFQFYAMPGFPSYAERKTQINFLKGFGWEAEVGSLPLLPSTSDHLESLAV